MQISAKQQFSLNDSNARINIWEGAVRSGKTYISLWRFIKELTYGPINMSKYPGKSLKEIEDAIDKGEIAKSYGEFAIICRTYDTFKKNILPLLGNMIGSDARYYFGKRELNMFGQTVHVVGADDERAEAKIRGPTFSGAYVDEATIIPESVFKMLISRCAMNGAKIFATTNPDSPYHWLKVDYLTDNPDVKSWQFTFDDNPNLPDEDKEYMKRQYRGLWYQRFIEGKWVQAEGAIYDFFKTSGLGSHIIDFPPGIPDEYVVGIDYGTTNPCAFVLLGCSRTLTPKIWVEDEYYFDSRVSQRQKTDAEYADDLRRFLQHRNPRCIYIDPSATSFRLELQKQGYTNLFEAKNDVISGIRTVSTYLSSGTLKIASKCRNLIKEFQSYVWDPKSLKKGEDKPLKENDHALDALRYAIFSHIWPTGNSHLTAEDIDRMHREVFFDRLDLPGPFRDLNDHHQYRHR